MGRPGPVCLGRWGQREETSLGPETQPVGGLPRHSLSTQALHLPVFGAEAPPELAAGSFLASLCPSPGGGAWPSAIFKGQAQVHGKEQRGTRNILEAMKVNC